MLDFDNQEEFTGTSLSKSSRIGFIRKVCYIVGAQLTLTSVFVIVGMLSTSYRLFVSSNIWLMIITLVVAFSSLIALACIPNLARSVPTNYILTLVFTIAESYLA